MKLDFEGGLYFISYLKISHFLSYQSSLHHTRMNELLKTENWLMGGEWNKQWLKHLSLLSFRRTFTFNLPSHAQSPPPKKNLLCHITLDRELSPLHLRQILWSYKRGDMIPEAGLYPPEEKVLPYKCAPFFLAVTPPFCGSLENKGFSNFFKQNVK